MSTLENFITTLQHMRAIDDSACELVRKQRGIDVTPSILHLLLSIAYYDGEHDPVATELAKRLYVTPQAVGARAYEATLLGLVEQVRDSADQRLRRLRLTDEAHEILELMERAAMKVAADRVVEAV